MPLLLFLPASFSRFLASSSSIPLIPTVLQPSLPAAWAYVVHHGDVSCTDLWLRPPAFSLFQEALFPGSFVSELLKRRHGIQPQWRTQGAYPWLGQPSAVSEPVRVHRAGKQRTLLPVFKGKKVSYCSRIKEWSYKHRVHASHQPSYPPPSSKLQPAHSSKPPTSHHPSDTLISLWRKKKPKMRGDIPLFWHPWLDQCLGMDYAASGNSGADDAGRWKDEVWHDPRNDVPLHLAHSMVWTRGLDRRAGEAGEGRRNVGDVDDLGLGQTWWKCRCGCCWRKRMLGAEKWDYIGTHACEVKVGPWEWFGMAVNDIDMYNVIGATVTQNGESDGRHSKWCKTERVMEYKQASVRSRKEWWKTQAVMGAQPVMEGTSSDGRHKQWWEAQAVIWNILDFVHFEKPSLSTCDFLRSTLLRLVLTLQMNSLRVYIVLFSFWEPALSTHDSLLISVMTVQMSSHGVCWVLFTFESLRYSYVLLVTCELLSSIQRWVDEKSVFAYKTVPLHLMSKFSLNSEYHLCLSYSLHFLVLLSIRSYHLC